MLGSVGRHPPDEPTATPLLSALRDRIYLTVPGPASTDPPPPRRRLAHVRTLGAAACLRLKAQRVGSEQRPHVTHGGQRGPEPARSCDQPRHWNRGARPTTCPVGPEAHRDQPPRFPAPTTHWLGLTGGREAKRSHPDFRLQVPRAHVTWNTGTSRLQGSPLPPRKEGCPAAPGPAGAAALAPGPRGESCARAPDAVSQAPLASADETLEHTLLWAFSLTDRHLPYSAKRPWHNPKAEGRVAPVPTGHSAKHSVQCTRHTTSQGSSVGWGLVLTGHHPMHL